MNISEMVKILIDAKERYGDLPVEVFSSQGEGETEQVFFENGNCGRTSHITIAG